MRKILLLFLFPILLNAQNNFEKFNLLFGDWEGTGSGFGGGTSVIKSTYHLVMDGTYIEVKHDSQFEPTDKNPEGDHHIDWGMISFDKNRNTIVYRQFNNEGFFNQYILNEEKSTDKFFVFETEFIENFMPGGKAKFTIELKSDNEIETNFYLSFPGKEFACFGTNKLKKRQ